MRTTATEVKQIIETTLIDSVVESYISAANTLMNSVLELEESEESSGEANHLRYTEIERWLAAHMIASTKERMAKSEEAGGAKITYMGDSGFGLQSTTYGQMVLLLDTSGAFAVQDMVKKKATWTSIKQN